MCSTWVCELNNFTFHPEKYIGTGIIETLPLMTVWQTSILSILSLYIIICILSWTWGDLLTNSMSFIYNLICYIAKAMNVAFPVILENIFLRERHGSVYPAHLISQLMAFTQVVKASKPIVLTLSQNNLVLAPENLKISIKRIVNKHIFISKCFITFQLNDLIQSSVSLYTLDQSTT